MKRRFIIVFILSIYFICSFNLKAQGDSCLISENDNTEIIKKYFNDFQDLHIGYYGTTQNCVAYNVYAFKFRRHWFLFVKQEESLSLMLVRPPIKGTSIDYPSKFLAEGIAHSHFIEYTKLKKRKRSVIDMNIYGFYKFNRFGRRVVKGLLLLDYPNYNKGFFRWRINPEKAKKKAEKEAKKAAKKASKKAIKDAKLEKIESVIPKINETVPIEKH